MLYIIIALSVLVLTLLYFYVKARQESSHMTFLLSLERSTALRNEETANYWMRLYGAVLQDKKHLESERDKLRKELMVRNGASQN